MPHGTDALPAVLDLSQQGHAAGFAEQRLRVAPHDQERHQILEERRAPREQRGHSPNARDRPPEPEPVRLGHIALRDGDEAGQARFGCQQIVVRRIETARAFGIRRAITDREEAARFVVEETGSSSVGENGRAPRQVVEHVARSSTEGEPRPRDPGAAVGPSRPRQTRAVRDAGASELARDGLEPRQDVGQPGEQGGSRRPGRSADKPCEDRASTSCRRA